MERKFKKGDLVRLKSDSTESIPMTVNGYWNDYPDSIFIETGKDDLLVVCVWRSKEGTPFKEKYPEETLELVNQ